MKASARYATIVEWSDEDNCYVGSAPGLILGGCHGDDKQVALWQIVDEVIALYERDGKPLPPQPQAVISPTACSVSSNKQLQRTVTRRPGDVASAPLHYALGAALRTAACGR
jgi:hypothetical protein